MRKLPLIVGILTAILGGAVQAETVVLDLHDYDDDLMKTLDQTIKYFEPDLQAGNLQAGTEDGQTLLDGFKWMENYFQKKGNAEEAVKISQQGEEFINAAMKSLAEKNFDAAADSAHSAARTCRTCHDTYKPIKVR